jgi:tetratricopeptide (TPR) repeat protein
MSASALNATLQGETDALIRAGDLPAARELGLKALEAAREAASEQPSWRSVLMAAIHDMARIDYMQGQHTGSEELCKEAIALGEQLGDQPQLLAKARTQYAVLLDEMGQNERSTAAYEEAVKDLETAGDNLTAARLRNNLALGYKRQGRFALAEQHYLRSVEVIEAAHGRESEEVGSLYNNLGGLYYAAGFPEQAKEMFSDALDVRKQLLGDAHPDVSQSLSNLAAVCYELGQHDDALKHYDGALNILEQHLGDPAEAASYEAVSLDYIALLNALQQTPKAELVEKRMQKALSASA